MNLQGYSPDFYADEAIWGWVREEATGNLCLGSKAKVQEWAHLSMRSHRISTTRATLELLLLVSITSLSPGFGAQKGPIKFYPIHVPISCLLLLTRTPLYPLGPPANKILPHTHA